MKQLQFSIFSQSCRSLTFGKRECNLYSTYLCHPQDRFHLSLVDSPGITYFDLHSDLHNTLVISKKEACLRYGRCLEKCEEGPWVTSTTTTSRTTTTSTTKPPSKDEKGGNGGKIDENHKKFVVHILVVRSFNLHLLSRHDFNLRTFSLRHGL